MPALWARAPSSISLNQAYYRWAKPTGKGLAFWKDMHKVYCTGHTAKGMKGNWNSAQALPAKPYVLWGAGSTWKSAPFAESVKASCQVLNQCSCKHLEGVLILTPPKEPIVLAAIVRKESKDWYLEWKEVKRQMGWDEKEMERKGQRLKQVQEIFKECWIRALHNDEGQTTKVY